MAKSPWVVETSLQTFQDDVFERSRTVPVLVDFWAAWCGPCRMIGPVLEKLADEYAGRFVLVKANTEELPEIATGFGVESIPAVFALRNGSVIDHFLGAYPEPEIRAWLDRILPSEAQVLAAEARDLEAVDLHGAEAKYRRALELSPNEISARIGLARTVLARGGVDEASEILQGLADLGALDAEGERLQAEIQLRQAGQAAGDVEAARAAAAAAPDNLALQLTLAQSLAAAGRYEEAFETCLALVRRDRQGVGEQAREFMVQLFHLLGPDSDLASGYRRKLALTLY